MSYRLTKRFRFESAHRLMKGYVGKCSRMHGHSWNGEVIIEMTTVDQFDMALDFSFMGKLVKKWDEEFDHRVFLQKDDPLCSVIKGEELVVFQANPTCETLAKMLHDDACEFLKSLSAVTKDHIKRVAVRVEETCTTSCTYES